jgi:L,D-transpeptidase catalytic domain
VSSISRKTVMWASGAVVAVGACTAGIVMAAQGGQPASGHAAGGAAAAKEAAARIPLHVVSISPASGTKDINGTTAITVTYNQALPASAPLPALTPAIAGSWRRTGDTAVFTPDIGFPQRAHVTVTVPGTAGSTAAGAAGNAAKASAVNAAPGSSPSASPEASAAAAAAANPSTAAALATATFSTSDYSTLRLQQIMAQLGYLPLTWTPAGSASAVGGSAAQQLAAAYQPPAGTFHWESGYPSELKSFWSQGQSNTMDRGAIMGFEAAHNLTVDGTASAKVWAGLLKAAAADQKNTSGYSYAIASKSEPETLTIWHDGTKVFSSPANTGIGVAPTADGTFPVYEKLPFQVMSGTNPDGSRYSDPVEWVSYFNGGDAVHYFNRYSYGFPQSLGCVELPYSAAKTAYPYLPYGTLVSVQ